MDENVYLFDYNVRLVFYSIEISCRMYLSNLTDYTPIVNVVAIGVPLLPVFVFRKVYFPLPQSVKLWNWAVSGAHMRWSGVNLT